MSIFILTEHIMNGTVTMSVKTTLIEAPNWERAFKKLTKFPEWWRAHHIAETKEAVTFGWMQDPGELVFTAWGSLSKKPAEVV